MKSYIQVPQQLHKMFCPPPPFNQVAAHIEKMPAAQVATPSRGDVSNLAVAAGFGAAAVAVGAYFMVPRTKKNKKRALQREESSIWTKTHVTWPPKVCKMRCDFPLLLSQILNCYRRQMALLQHLWYSLRWCIPWLHQCRWLPWPILLGQWFPKAWPKGLVECKEFREVNTWWSNLWQPWALVMNNRCWWTTRKEAGG